MAHRIYVSSKIADARAKVKKQQFDGILGKKNKLGAVYLAECYTIDAELNKKQIEKTKTLLANHLSQNASSSTLNLAPSTLSYAIEIGFMPGVTDNIGNTAKETLSDGAGIKFKTGQNVYSSQVLFISGGISLTDAEKISASLYNPLIQRAKITSFNEFKKSGLDFFVPKVKLSGSNKVTKVDLNVSDKELTALGKFGIADTVIARSASDAAILKKGKIASAALAMTRRGPLSLSLEELKAIREYFNSMGRKPTDIELECLAQTWSEHCKHTIFADPMDELKDGIYKTYIRAATAQIRKQKQKSASLKGVRGDSSENSSENGDFCVSVFTDNAGGISFDEDWIISHKVETHNTPSALDPFGGSITGIVGVNRDAIGFGLGSKPVANFFGFCLADPENKTELFRDKSLKQPMLSAKRIMDGVISGINAGGNQSGIPTPLGFLYFDDRFRGKPLVFAGTLGLTPKKIGKKNGWEKEAKKEDLIVMVGGRVGADGIHGATFSSEGLDTHSPQAAVQIGDPITQKKLSDAIVKEARGLGLYNSITDCGAGGLSSAVAEMAKDSNGCKVNLDTVPLKYPGLYPWQIWISESQERMILSVPKNKWKQFFALMQSRGVEATAIGKFTNSENCIVKYGNQTILNIEMDFLHNGRPKKQLKTERSVPIHQPTYTPINGNDTKHLLSLLSSPNITSTEFVNNQYDHEVQGSSILKPLQGRGRVNSEASIFRPILNSQKAVATSFGLHPELSEIDPYAMAAHSIDSAIRAAVSVGADVDYLAILDNFCWCSPQDPKRLWQLKEAARACFDYAVAFGTPFISGKDSMHNDFKGYDANGNNLDISIPPTLLITTVGVVPDIEKVISLDAKISDDLIYLLGKTKLHGNLKVDAKENLTLYRSVFKASQKNLISSSITVNRGGLAVALAKKLIGGGLGAIVDITKVLGECKNNADILFSENDGKILVSVDSKKSAEFEKLMSGNTISKIGRITQDPVLKICGKSRKTILNIKISDLEKSYKARFKNY
jgi:phosphoribosylformylglycinamidine synthase II